MAVCCRERLLPLAPLLRPATILIHPSFVSLLGDSDADPLFQDEGLPDEDGHQFPSVSVREARVSGMAPRRPT
eukprot:2549207-Pyramimonas_sp.AAC.1